MNNFSKNNPRPAQTATSSPKRAIRSVKCNAGSTEEQDETIKRVMGDGWDYLDSTMIYGGQVVIRFEKRA